MLERRGLKLKLGRGPCDSKWSIGVDTCDVLDSHVRRETTSKTT